jgi:hypothetical protein
LLDGTRQHERRRHHAEGEEIVGARIVELHEQRGMLALHGHGDFLVAEKLHHDTQDERVRQRGEAEVDAGEAERRQPDDDRGHHRQRHAGEHADPRRELELDLEERGRVGADAEEGLVAERHLAAVAADDVPGQAHRGPDEDQRQHAVVVLLREPERQQQAGGDDPGDHEPVSSGGSHLLVRVRRCRVASRGWAFREGARGTRLPP